MFTNSYYTKKLRLAVVIFFICLLNANFIFNQNLSSIKITQNPELSYTINEDIVRINEIGSWEQNLGNVDNIIVKGDLAYIGGGDCTLSIVNISDINNLEVIGTYDSGTILTTNLYLQNSTLFISKGSSGLDIIDVSDPYNPKEISHRGFYYIREVAVKDNYLFSTDNYMDLHVFDISNLSNIDLVATINTGSSGSYGLELVNNYVFLANGNEGLKIYDVEDPLHPVLVSQNNLFGTNFYEISVQNNISYLLDASESVITFDVSNISNPIILDSYTGLEYDDFFVEDNFIYVTGQDIGLEILNCTNPDNITLTHSFAYIGNPTNIFIKENYAFITDWVDCLKIIDISNKTSPIPIKSFGNGELKELFIQDDYAYLIDSTAGFIILNLTDPTHPRKISSYSDENEFTGVYIHNDFAFISIENNGFKILNLTDISNPYMLSHVYDGGNASDIYASSSRVYLADGVDGLEIYDITNVSAPIKIKSSYFASPPGVSFSADKMTIESGFAYVIDYNDGIFVIEIKDNANMGLIHDFALEPNFRDCVIANGFCYISKASGIYLYDITNPDNIWYSTFYSYSYAYHLSLISKDYLLSAGNTGFRLINIQTEGLDTINMYENDGTKSDIKLYKRNIILANSAEASDIRIVRIDGDMDGLSDIDELLTYNTYPDKADSDSDELYDGDEIFIYKTDPMNPDSDSDGLGDGFEITIGTDPNDSDSDDDGYSDGYEYYHGSDPLDPNSVPRFQIWMVYVAIIFVTLVISTLLVINIIQRSKGKK
ncbi:MAG TPA: hypothetical protein VMZ29_02445 [Candidatus Bathyarchaeia archaeon]|nr:hypothetical protein [Candidatus Bathyarchaeia archaeon]